MTNFIFALSATLWTIKKDVFYWKTSFAYNQGRDRGGRAAARPFLLIESFGQLSQDDATPKTA